MDIKLFYSCSYGELKDCIKYRLNQIDDIEKAQDILREHAGPLDVIISLSFRKYTYKAEIKELYQLRHKMHQTKVKHVRDLYEGNR